MDKILAKTRYVVISAVRNEEKYIERTIRCVVAQTIKPAEWIIVNDGSVDRTGELIDKYANEYEWIMTTHRDDRGFREAGSGVVEAFYEGYNSLLEPEWDFIVKLDGDLSFGSDCFERCFERFRANAKLGIAGAGIYDLANGKLKLEEAPAFHVRGATKIYRRECWDAIGGLVVAIGWDTVDEVKANMLGWETRTFANIKVIHHRPTGKADGTWRSLVKYGVANYVSGYHPIFMSLKCIRRAFKKPYVVGSLGLYYGFLSGYLKRMRRVQDRSMITYLRRQQMRRLFLKPSIWR